MRKAVERSPILARTWGSWGDLRHEQSLGNLRLDSGQHLSVDVIEEIDQ